MTKNQLEYMKLREEQRANRAQEDIKGREADIKAGELEVKKRSQTLEELMSEYNRYGSGGIANIARLIQSYGNDTGIDDVIKNEATEANARRVKAASTIKNSITSMPQKWRDSSGGKKARIIWSIANPAYGASYTGRAIANAIRSKKEQSKNKEDNLDAK